MLDWNRNSVSVCPHSAVAARGRDGQFRAGTTRVALRQVALGLAAIVPLLASCSAVGPERQRLVAKPNMLFSDTVIFNYQDKLLPQTEPGSAVSGGAQASGCTSCR